MKSDYKELLDLIERVEKKWEQEIDKCGEIWTTPFGIHDVRGLSTNLNIDVAARCDTKPMKELAHDILSSEKNKLMKRE